MPFVKISQLQVFQLEDIKEKTELKTDEEIISFFVAEYREKYG